MNKKYKNIEIQIKIKWKWYMRKKKIMGYNSMKFKIAQQKIKSENIFQKHIYIYICALLCCQPWWKERDNESSSFLKFNLCKNLGKTKDLGRKVWDFTIINT
jgi:hypothetical protein